MRDYIFRGKRVDTGEWVEGNLTVWSDGSASIDNGPTMTSPRYAVIPASVGQYTGFDEWMLDDASRDAKLYEGDIIEVWCDRKIYGSPRSTHDKKVKLRGVIVFDYGKWHIDFNNKHNETICQAKGKEKYDREVPWGCELYRRNGFNRIEDRDEYRKKKLKDREQCLKWGFDDNSYYDDIVKIGTVFENEDLLEGWYGKFY